MNWIEDNSGSLINLDQVRQIVVYNCAEGTEKPFWLKFSFGAFDTHILSFETEMERLEVLTKISDDGSRKS